MILGMVFLVIGVVFTVNPSWIDVRNFVLAFFYFGGLVLLLIGMMGSRAAMR